jgi:C4-dicarboxylate-specific signal transduction histidine kinase
MAFNIREKTVLLQEAQKKLHEQNLMLEEMVKERTAELLESNQKLQLEIEERQRAVKARQKLEAQYMEAQKMEAIATLAGGIAHQFNNALAVISGNIELMQLESSHIGNIKKTIAPMQASVQRMSQLTDQLLAYARGGRYYAEPVSVSNFRAPDLT